MNKYAVIAPSSMGIRLTPLYRQPVHTSEHFVLKATSAETNVLSIPAALGMNVMVLTKFVKDSPVATIIKRDLRARGIKYEGAEVEQGGAWGYRHQINIADSGYGLRGPRVWNDRSGEVGLTMNIDEFDIEQIFGRDGSDYLHLSGLICALSSETGRFCLELARTARKYGTKISFDLNYRASFWKNRERELREIFSEIASVSDVLIGNEEDFQLALGLPGPDAGGSDIEGKISGFKEMISGAQNVYPNVKTFATTLRQVISANKHLWGALLYTEGSWHIEQPRAIEVFDRIGGGDAFVGGLLYALCKGLDAEKCLQLAWASGALAATMIEDYAFPADEEQLWSIYGGNARVKR